MQILLTARLVGKHSKDVSINLFTCTVAHQPTHTRVLTHRVKTCYQILPQFNRSDNKFTKFDSNIPTVTSSTEGMDNRITRKHSSGIGCMASTTVMYSTTKAHTYMQIQHCQELWDHTMLSSHNARCTTLHATYKYTLQTTHHIHSQLIDNVMLV